MISEQLQVKRFLGARFGYGEPIPDGKYAVPTNTSKGRAFIKIEFKNDQTHGDDNFKLFWDEALTLNWYDNKNPRILPESTFATAFRNLESALFETLKWKE